MIKLTIFIPIFLLNIYFGNYFVSCDENKRVDKILNFDTDPFYVDQIRLPLIIATWNFTAPAEKAWYSLLNKASYIDSLVEGLSVCELETEKCDYNIGYQGPNESGETTMDAVIMDGTLLDSGAVGGLKRVKNAIGVAKYVLENTKHSLITGEEATKFADAMGFRNELLTTIHSFNEFADWKYKKHCQPNHWTNVMPNPEAYCGPYRGKETPYFIEREFFNVSVKPSENFSIKNLSYKLSSSEVQKIAFENLTSIEKGGPFFIATEEEPKIDEMKISEEDFNSIDRGNINMIVIDEAGNTVAGATSQGAEYKIPGAVGNGAIVGGSAYAVTGIGAAITVGDSDIIQRFLPSYLAVERLRDGKYPTEAAGNVLRRITAYYPDFKGALIVANSRGNYAGVCIGMDRFPFTIINQIVQQATILWIECYKPN